VEGESTSGNSPLDDLLDISLKLSLIESWILFARGSMCGTSRTYLQSRALANASRCVCSKSRSKSRDGHSLQHGAHELPCMLVSEVC